MQGHVMRHVSLQSSPASFHLAEVQMFLGFVETHPFLFGLQKPTDKIFGEIIVFAPDLLIEGDLSLENVGDGIGMVL